MPMMPPPHRPFGRSVKDERRRFERERGSASERLYDWQWQKARLEHLTEHPLCAYCALDGRVTAASLVDHLYPHRGNITLFWERRWWVSSCNACHSGMKQAIEREGRAALDALALRLGLPKREGEGGIKSLASSSP